MRKTVIALALLCVASVLSAQNFEYKWQRVRMDDTYESGKILKVDEIVAAHQEEMGPMMEVIIYAEDEIERGQPESALSNLAVDFLRYAAEPFIDNDYPTMALTNFGGIRSNFPKGAIRVYDIYSTFPFDNAVVIAQIKGEYLLKIVNRFAGRGKFEALGGVQVVVKDNELEKFEVEGEPIEADKMYNLVTIDFLLDGGDRFRIADDAESVQRTGIMMRDAAIKYLRELSEEGAVLKNETEGRVIIEED